MRDPLLQVTPRSSEMTCHEELCPTVFSSKTETIKIINQLRSSQSNQLIVPPVTLSTYGSHSFAVAGRTIWNNLPEYLRDLEISNQEAIILGVS